MPISEKIIIVLFLVIIIWLIRTIWNQDAKSRILWWNKQLAHFSDEIDIHNAWEANISIDVNNLQQELCLQHEQIKEKYLNLHIVRTSLPNKEIYRREYRWNPIWIKPHSDNISNFLNLSDKIIYLYITQIQPHTNIIDHYGLSRGVYRYCYGLDIPRNGKVCLKVANRQVILKAKEGFFWEGDKIYSILNETDTASYIICAEIYRDFGVFYNLGNDIIYNLSD